MGLLDRITDPEALRNPDEGRMAELRGDIVKSLGGANNPELLHDLEEIDSPEFLAALAEECASVRRVADHFGWSFTRALAVLDADDHEAMERFAVGNSVPRETLH